MGVITIWNNLPLAFISWEMYNNITSIAFNQVWHHLYIDRCIIDINGIDVTNCLLSLTKMSYHIATVTLPIVRCIASLPLIHNNTLVLKSMLSKCICVSICMQPSFLFPDIQGILTSTLLQQKSLILLPDFLSTSGHSSPSLLWGISPHQFSVLLIGLERILLDLQPHHV